MDVKTAGQLGGRSTLQKRGLQYFKNLSRLGVQARINKKMSENGVKPSQTQKTEANS